MIGKRLMGRFLVLFISTFTFLKAHSQSTLRGKVVDENGESLPGAIIALKYDRSQGTATDFDGNYSFRLGDTAVTVVYSMVGLIPVEEKIQPIPGAVVVRNVTLRTTALQMKEVEISAKAVRSNDYYFETIRKKSAASIDFISSDVMKKTGDNTVTAAISRVSGVSTNGALITVRGIGDRYVKTTINGLRIPTLDPFTNNIRLDLFPAGLVDNIVITKTFSPDLPGDWAGAYISVETKDYPEQLSVGVETTFGYNTQTSLHDVISSERSKTDWLGYDNSLRDRSNDEFNYAFITPTRYQELSVLGLKGYYDSLGVSQNNWGEGTSTGDYYFRLGLVRLGILAPAQINDVAAVAAAVQAYEAGPYKNSAFSTLNAPAVRTGQSFSDNWNSIERKAPLNFSQTFTVGNQTTLFGKTFGYIFGFRYGSSMVYDGNSTTGRATVAQGPDGELVDAVASSATQQISRETNGWSALLNLSFKPNANNTISVMAMPNLSGVNNVRRSVDTQDPTNYVITNSQFYEQRRQMVYQLRTQHYVPFSRTKIEFNSSYTAGRSSAPDFKNVQYYYDPNGGYYQIGGSIGDGIHRYYRYLADNLWDNRLRIEQPFFQKEGLSRKIIYGGSYEHNDKLSDQYDYFINFGPYSTLQLVNNDLNALFAPENFALRNIVDQNGKDVTTLDMYYSVINSPANNTFGRSDITSAFLMTDYSLNQRWRFAGGVRVEIADIYSDVVLFDSLDYPVNDPRRSYSTSYPLANPGSLSQTDLLPSLNVIYRLRESEEAPVNIRFNFSKTLARPSIRELSDIALLDYEYRLFVFGNSDLKTVRINNYDVRYEYYSAKQDNFSASLFYKTFQNHIEIVKSVGLTWQNVDNSFVAGIELEGKKTLSKGLDIRANLSLIYSQTEFVRQRLDLSEGVKVYYPLDTVKRPMFGQAPYVLNAIISYSTPDDIRYKWAKGATFTLSYNVQGPRLVIAADVPEIPDIYERPRNLIDIKISKAISKHFTANLTIKDLLNAPFTRAYDYQSDFSLNYDSYRFGTIYQLGIAYKL